MLDVPLPEDVFEAVNDEKRLQALSNNIDLSEHNVAELDIITSMLAKDFNARIALVSLVYKDVQFFQSHYGLEASQTPVQQSFCAHAITVDAIKPFIILDASKDSRFNKNALVTGEPNIRFYAGIPLVVDGQKLGTLCVIDDKPRTDLEPDLVERLKNYGTLVSNILGLRTDAKLKTQAEKQHLSEVKRHRLALKASNVVAWVWNLETDIVDCDPELLELFNIEYSEITSAETIFSQIHFDDIDDIKEQLDSILVTDGDFHGEFRIPSNGKWLLGQGSVLDRDGSGKALKIAGVNIDITERKHAEEKTNLLLRELNHRVKNTLAMLQSIANQTLKNSRTPEEFKKAFSGRVRSLAAAHTLLSDKEWEPIDLAKLLRDQVNVYVDDIDKQLVIEGEQVNLGPEESLALGMVLHELATNAAKYGSLSVEGGYIEILTRVDDNQLLEIKWREINGPKVTAPETTGFGSIMIKRSLDKVIGSNVDLEYLPDGVEAKITIPLSN